MTIGDSRSLRRRAVDGARYTGIATIAVTAFGFLQTAILGRLLGPEAWGLMAMVHVWLGFANVVSLMGLPEAVIQRKSPTRDELASLYWINIGASLTVCALSVALAPLLATGFREPELARLVPVAALALLILPLGALYGMLAQKELNFGFVSAVRVANSGATLLVSFVTAIWFEQGVWSLVWGNLAGAVVTTVANVVFGLRQFGFHGFHFAWRDLDGYFGFGMYRVGANIVNYANSNVDQLLVGALLGSQMLGYYRMAVNLILQPINRLNPIITQVAFPFFSKIQDDTDRMRRSFLKIIRMLALIDAPILVGLGAVAPAAVPLILGDDWTPAVPVIQVLALYGLIRALPSAAGGVVMAKGKASWAFYWNVVLLFVIPPVMFLSARTGGLLTMAWALVGMQATFLLIHHRVYLKTLIHLRLSDYVRSFATPFFAAVVMGVAVHGLGLAMAGIPPVTILTAQVAAGAGLYLLLAWSGMRTDIREAFRMARGKG